MYWKVVLDPTDICLPLPLQGCDYKCVLPGLALKNILENKRYYIGMTMTASQFGGKYLLYIMFLPAFSGIYITT